MKLTYRLIIAMVAVFLVFANVTRADALSGNVSVSINGNSTATDLWGISGSYNVTFGDLAVDETIDMQPNGKFTGTATISGNEGGISINVDFDFAGSISQAGSVTKVAMNMNGKGNVSVDLAVLGLGNNTVSGSVAFALVCAMSIDTDAQTLDGTMGGSVSIKVSKQPGLARTVAATQKLPKTDINLPLDASMDGSWSLNLDNVSLSGKNKYAGSGAIVLSDGTAFDFTISGAFTPKTGVSSITLAGSGATKGINIIGLFTFNSDTGNLTPSKKFTGKVAGQTFTLTPSSSFSSNSSGSTASDSGLSVSIRAPGAGGSGLVLIGLGNSTAIPKGILGSNTTTFLGNTTSGNTSGNGTSGNSSSGNTTSGNSSSGNTTFGNTTGNTSGNSSGNTTSGNFTFGNTTGNGTSGNSSSGNSTSGNMGAGNGTGGNLTFSNIWVWPVPDSANVSGYASLAQFATVGNIAVTTDLILYRDQNWTISSGESLTITDGGTVSLPVGSNLTVAPGGNLMIEGGGTLLVYPGSTFTIAGGGNFTVLSGGNYTIVPSSNGGGGSSGNTTGNSTSGNSSGNTTSGNFTFGNTTGNSSGNTSGNGTSGNSSSGNFSFGNTTGNGTSGNSSSGNTTFGNTTGNTSGNSSSGNFTSGNTSGNGTSGNTSSGNLTVNLAGASAAGSLSAAWSQQESQQAALWINTLPDGAARDGAIGVMTWANLSTTSSDFGGNMASQGGQLIIGTTGPGGRGGNLTVRRSIVVPVGMSSTGNTTSNTDGSSTPDASDQN